MMAKPSPSCAAGPRWLVERFKDRSVLAPLTGQDTRALAAFFHLLELYVASDGSGRESAIVAMRATLAAMQPKCRHLAKAAIPCILDWADEDPLWRTLTGAA